MHEPIIDLTNFENNLSVKRLNGDGKISFQAWCTVNIAERESTFAPYSKTEKYSVWPIVVDIQEETQNNLNAIPHIVLMSGCYGNISRSIAKDSTVFSRN